MFHSYNTTCVHETATYFCRSRRLGALQRWSYSDDLNSPLAFFKGTISAGSPRFHILLGKPWILSFTWTPLDANHLPKHISKSQHTTPWTVQLRQNTMCSVTNTHTHTTTTKNVPEQPEEHKQELKFSKRPGSKWGHTACLATNTTRGLLLIINPGTYASSPKKDC